jgi:hypothetical protein
VAALRLLRVLLRIRVVGAPRHDASCWLSPGGEISPQTLSSRRSSSRRPSREEECGSEDSQSPRPAQVPDKQGPPASTINRRYRPRRRRAASVTDRGHRPARRRRQAVFRLRKCEPARADACETRRAGRVGRQASVARNAAGVSARMRVEAEVVERARAAQAHRDPHDGARVESGALEGRGPGAEPALGLERAQVEDSLSGTALAQRSLVQPRGTVTRAVAGPRRRARRARVPAGRRPKVRRRCRSAPGCAARRGARSRCAACRPPGRRAVDRSGRGRTARRTPCPAARARCRCGRGDHRRGCAPQSESKAAGPRLGPVLESASTRP